MGRDNEREKERWECTCREREKEREREREVEREALERNTCFTSRNETNKQKQNREILKFVALDGRINQFWVAPILSCGSEEKKIE